MKTLTLGADFLKFHFDLSMNMATHSLIDSNTKLEAKGITSLYTSTGISSVIPTANGVHELIKKIILVLLLL